MFCVEQVINVLGLDPRAYQSTLDLLWSYTNSMELDVWEEDVYSEIGQELAYVREHVDAPLLVQQAIAYVVEVGLGNLYGGVTGYSKHTWVPIAELIELLEEHGIDVPDVKPFLKSRFSEADGWGDPFTPDSIIAD